MPRYHRSPRHGSEFMTPNPLREVGYRQTPDSPGSHDAGHGGERLLGGELPGRWGSRGAGERYRRRRFGTSRAAERDLRLAGRLLDRWAPGTHPTVLDGPCGAGRLHPLLSPRADRLLALDLSWEMLGATLEGSLERELRLPVRIQSRLEELPLGSRSVDLAVCCRLMHHLDGDEARVALLSELLRVSKGTVIFSFWDSGSWHALRRRLGLRLGRSHPDPRVACSRSELERLVNSCGGRVLGYASSFRFVSPQTFCAITRRT